MEFNLLSLSRKILFTIALLTSISIFSKENNSYEMLFPSNVSGDTSSDVEEAHKILGSVDPNFVFTWIIPSHYVSINNIDNSMALDFVARYLTHCSTDDNKAACVKKFEPFYTLKSSKLMTREALYGILLENKNYDMEDFEYAEDEVPVELQDSIRHNRLQSIADYQNLKVEPVTSAILIEDIQSNAINLKKILADLPSSVYLIRGLDSYNSVYKHLAVFIKNKDSIIYFDATEGAFYEKNSNKSNLIKEIDFQIADWPFSEIRIYKVSCNENECTNIAD